VVLDFFAPAPHVGQNPENAALGDSLDTPRGDEQGDKTLLFGDPESLVVQIGLKAPPGLAVRVADVVSISDRLAGHGAPPTGDGGFGIGHLLRLPKKLMLAAKPAVFLEFKAIRSIALVLGAGIAHLLACRAFEQNFISHDPASLSKTINPEAIQIRPFSANLPRQPKKKVYP
jgi:hypothetical protein